MNLDLRFRIFEIISKNPSQLATEFCLASVKDETIRNYYINKSLPTCDDSAFIKVGKRPSRKNEKKGKNAPKIKRKNKPKRKLKNRKTGGKRKNADDDRLSGSSVYLSSNNPNGETSYHHPWQCSLRFQGFRGRHRCGVTLLSGPTEQSPSDPFVLVGAAHCNYICKDKRTGYPLETCCCRPKSIAGSCRRDRGRVGSPFCPENPADAEFKLADPEDLVIVCGEFDTDVELIWWSYEPEEILEIVEIINHPRYKPHEVLLKHEI